MVATASARNHEFLRELGAAELIDYRSERFEERVGDVDVVLDTVRGYTLKRSAVTLRKGGRLVSIVGVLAEESCRKAGIRCLNTDAQAPSQSIGMRLARLGELIDQRRIRINVDAVLPLEEAAKAQELNREGHTPGKIVLRVR